MKINLWYIIIFPQLEMDVQYTQKVLTVNFIFELETLGLIAGVRSEGNQNHVLYPSRWWDSGPTVLSNFC
jgi:hypothetical protein